MADTTPPDAPAPDAPPAPVVPAAEVPVPDDPDGRAAENPATAGLTDKEILDAAPPLILPDGMTALTVCANPNCGLQLQPGPGESLKGRPCPNCGTELN